MEGKRQINLKLEENGRHQDMKKKLCGIMQSVRLSVPSSNLHCGKNE
jgi:hypothetical protein